MTAQTHTVVSGFTDRSGQHWVFVRGIASKLAADEPYPDGTAVKVTNGRAVK